MWKTFLAGAAAYPLLELCWRGRTHPTMAAAGGVSLVLLRRLARTRRPLWLAALAGGAGITCVEGLVGLAFNRDHRIWDYRRLPLNWRGQVCLPFSAAWCLLSAIVLHVLRKNGSRGKAPCRVQGRRPCSPKVP